MKTALVTGGTGFIGTYLANELHSRGINVTIVDIAYGFRDLLSRGINFIQKDIRTGGIDGRFDFIYHLAAKKSVQESFLYPQDYMSTNIWGTYHLMNNFPNSRFVNVSSSAASEPKSVYGITKRSSELFTNLHQNRVNVRFMNVFGERQLDTTMAIPAFMYCLKHNQQATIFGDGKVVRDYTYVCDVVDRIIEIGESKRKGTTDIGYGSPIKIIDLYNTLCKISKKKSNVRFDKPRKGDMKKTCAKVSISEPRFGFNEGLRRTVKWYLSCRNF